MTIGVEWDRGSKEHNCPAGWYVVTETSIWYDAEIPFAFARKRDAQLAVDNFKRYKVETDEALDGLSDKEFRRIATEGLQW